MGSRAAEQLKLYTNRVELPQTLPTLHPPNKKSATTLATAAGDKLFCLTSNFRPVPQSVDTTHARLDLNPYWTFPLNLPKISK